MRQAGTIPNETDARRLVDYLLTVGIEAQAEPTTSGGWGLWIVDEASIARGKEELARFLDQPNDAKYVQAAKAATDLRQQEARQRLQGMGDGSPGIVMEQRLTGEVLIKPLSSSPTAVNV